MAALLSLAAMVVVAAQAPPELGDAPRERGDELLGVALYGEGPLPAVQSGIPSPAANVHGVLRVRWLKPRLWANGTLELDYNTDTLTLAWHQPEMFGKRTHLSAYLVGEAFGARLLLDHARAGLQVPERAFSAWYALAGVTGSILFARPRGGSLWMDIVVGARQWLFTPIPAVEGVPLLSRAGTSPELVLPPDMQVVEIGLRLRVEHYRRVSLLAWRHGVWGFGRIEGHMRTGARPWGRLGDVDDGRNRHGVGIPLLAEAGAGGRHVGGRLLRFVRPVAEAQGSLGAGLGLDDINRFLVGGESPWVVPLAGAHWAEWYADRYAAVHVGGGLLLRERMGVTAGLEVASVNDPLRAGALDDVGVFSGAFVDMQWAILDGLLARVRFGHGLALPTVEGDRRLKLAVGLSYALW